MKGAGLVVNPSKKARTAREQVPTGKSQASGRWLHLQRPVTRCGAVGWVVVVLCGEKETDSGRRKSLAMILHRDVAHIFLTLNVSHLLSTQALTNHIHTLHRAPLLPTSQLRTQGFLGVPFSLSTRHTAPLSSIWRTCQLAVVCSWRPAPC
jgi:hypothetical protein